MRSIDLNADVGEGAGNDHELIAYISSANIACGAHAGNEQTMHAAVRRAAELGVAVGAHPGHADREYYGRRELPLTPAEAARLVKDQVGRLKAVADQHDARVLYVKPHGALYHQLAGDAFLARAAVDAIAACSPESPLAVLGLAESHLEEAALRAGVRFYAEAFADRHYGADGRLVPRGVPGAMFEDEAEVVSQAIALAVGGTVASVDGDRLGVRCDSICLHGDSRWAVEFAAGVRYGLERRGVRVASPLVTRS